MKSATPSRVSPPRVLLVEDDPVSRAFLTAATSGVPADVDSADCMAAALVLAGSQGYDLWLFDAQLPDGSGIELLQRLQAQSFATLAGSTPPAFAHTACTEPATHQALRAAGFDQVLVKPLSAAVLQATIRSALGLVPGTDAADATSPSAIYAAGGASTPVWDDESAALALNGNHTHIQTLRGLFLHELPQMHARIVDAIRSGDIDTAGHHLHKLRASCGFVGASRLAAAVHNLQKHPGDAGSLQCFDEAARTTTAQGDAAPTGTDQPAPSS